eukprot:53467-Pelagomonas_calceolata.AAC.1
MASKYFFGMGPLSHTHIRRDPLGNAGLWPRGGGGLPSALRVLWGNGTALSAAAASGQHSVLQCTV